MLADQPCLCCGHEAEWHHLTTQKNFGGNAPDNMMPLCREHHTEIGMGLGKLMEKYPRIKHWLIEHNRYDVIGRTKKI